MEIRMTTKTLDLAQFEGHTPGPWYPSDSGTVRGKDCGDGIGNLIAECAMQESAPARNNNARLIATAPALLAECKRQREQIAKMREVLEDLTLRCDGAEGIRADGSNIQTIKAHAALGTFAEEE